VRFPDIPFENRYYRDYNRRLRGIMKQHFPFEMSVKMLLKPVDLPRPVERPLSRLAVRGVRTLVFG
jgi:hypothetical protein